MLKFIFAALLALGFCEARSVGAPNPLVEYASYDEVARKVGFAPLFLPSCSGFEPSFFIAISGKIADLGYERAEGANLNNSNLNAANAARESQNPKAKIRVRTARAKDGGSDISGIYGAKWEARQILGARVEIAAVGERVFAARWHAGEFVFSAFGEGLDESEFANILKGLAQTSARYF